MLLQKSFSQYGIVIRKKNIQQDIDSIKNGNRENEEEVSGSISQENHLDRERGGGEEEEKNEEDLMIKKKEEKEKLFSGVKAWTSMKIQLLAHGTHICRENNDLNTAVNTLCFMIRLMGELEKRQQDQLKSWTNSISFIDDDKYDNNTQRIRNNSTDLDISENGDDIKNGNYSQNDIRKLLASSEGRKQITTELIAKKWILHNNNNNDNSNNHYDCDPIGYNNLETNYAETQILSTTNISRIGFSSSPGSFSLPGPRGTETGPGTGRSGSIGFVGRGSTTSRLSGGRRGSGNPSVIATFANDFETRVAVGMSSRSSFKIGKKDVYTDDVTEVRVQNNKSRNVSPSGLLKGTSLILQKELKKDFRIESIYDEKDIEVETNIGYNINRNSNSNSNSNSKSHRKGGSSGPNSRIGRHSGPGSVSSISFYTVFSPPSILGISANTEKRRQQNSLKKKNSYSAAGRLVNAQLQSYQTISNSASDAANFLSSMILPDDQLLPVPPTNSNNNNNTTINNKFPSKFDQKRGLKGFNNISGSVMKAGLNLSNLSAPKMKLSSKSKLNSIALNGPMNGRTASPLPQQQQQQQQPAISVSTPSVNSTSLKITRDKSGEENSPMTMMTSEIESPSECSLLDSCLESLSRMLFEGGSTSAQQEEGIDLLGQLSREVPLILIIIMNYVDDYDDNYKHDNCYSKDGNKHDDEY